MLHVLLVNVKTVLAILVIVTAVGLASTVIAMGSLTDHQAAGLQATLHVFRSCGQSLFLSFLPPKKPFFFLRGAA